MERDELKSITENVLLAADQPVHVGELQKLFLNTAEKKLQQKKLTDVQHHLQVDLIIILEKSKKVSSNLV